MPFPAKDDFAQLFEKLSEDTKKRISSAAKSDEQEQRLADLMRAAILTRVYSQPTREDLQKFYASMKPEDPRREFLEGLDRDELYKRLRFLYSRERFPGFRGGGRGGPGPRGGGPPGGEFGQRPPGGEGGPPPPLGKQP